MSKRLHRGSAQHGLARVDAVDQAIADAVACARIGSTLDIRCARNRPQERSEADGFGSNARVVVTKRDGEARQQFRRHSPRLQRELPCRGSVAARYGSDFHDQGDFLLARNHACRKQGSLGVYGGELDTIVHVGERCGDRDGRFRVVGVLQYLNRPEPGPGILMFQAGGDLLEGVLLCDHGWAEAQHYVQHGYQHDVQRTPATRIPNP